MWGVPSNLGQFSIAHLHFIILIIKPLTTFWWSGNYILFEKKLWHPQKKHIKIYERLLLTNDNSASWWNKMFIIFNT